jgi:menaquinone-9 beta-reductase
MEYDLICIGGGIAGASLGRALAEHGARVLIIERETRFRDRVRGETIHPWGVVDARALGIADRLLATCGQEVRWWRSSSVGTPEVQERDLVATTPHRAGELTFYHPQMQETLLRAAAEAGAEVRRGVTAIGPWLCRWQVGQLRQSARG